MPTLEFRCPGCQHPLQVDSANAGKKAKCPHCGALALIPGAPATNNLPAAPRVARRDDDEDEGEEDVLDPREAARAKRRQWRMARIALIVIVSGIGVIIAGLVLEQVFHVLLTIGLVKLLTASATSPPSGGGGGGGGISSDDVAKAMQILVGCSQLIRWLGALTCVVGYGLLLLGPRKVGPMVLAGAAFVLGGINLILALVFRVFFSFSLRDDVGRVPIWLHLGPSRFRGGGDFGVSMTEIIFHRIMVNLFFALEWVVVGFVLWVLLREMRRKRMATPVLVVAIAAGVFAVLQLFYQLIIACITPESEGGIKALLWIYLITYWLGFFAQVGIYGALIMQMLKVRSAAEEAA
jgi:hypothetical protein